MANISKQKYFLLDADFYKDERIIKLIGCQGGGALTIFLALLGNVRHSICGYYIRWEEYMFSVLSAETGYGRGYIREVISYCSKNGLLDYSLLKQGVITSKEIQERYVQLCKLQRRKAKIKEYSLLDGQEECTTTKKTLQQEVARQTQIECTTTNTIVKPLKEKITEQLDKEIDEFMADRIWLEHIQMLHSIREPYIKQKLPEFKAQCIASGKTGHLNINEAKNHFNNWLRIKTQIERKKQKDNDNNKTDKTRPADISRYTADDYTEGVF